MKKISIVFFVILISTAMYFGITYVLYESNLIIPAVSVKDIQTGETFLFKPDNEEYKKIIESLKGTPIDEVSAGSDFRSYELTLNNKLNLTKKRYNINFDDDYNVYIQKHSLFNSNKTSDFLPLNSSFFYSHECFDSLYPYRNAPEVLIETASGKKADPSLVRACWSYRRLDGSWISQISQPFISTQSLITNAVSEATVENMLIIKNPKDLLLLNSIFEPDSVRFRITDENGKTILEKKTKEPNIPVVEEDGIYYYEVELTWNDASKSYLGSYTYQFPLKVDLPASFSFSHTSAVQGELINVKVRNLNENENPVLIQDISEMFSFFRTGSECNGYIATNFHTLPGTHEIFFGLEGEKLKTISLTVAERDFDIQYMYIDPQIEQSTMNEEAVAEYNLHFNPVRLTTSNECYYTENFISPVRGELTTEFGEIRYVNGVLSYDRHSGLDIAAPAGDPVYAANRGKVVLSMHLIMTGNTVVIDHGQGLFSVYFHMQDLLVEKGSIVERGEQIGTIGSTGFSTGPHLHFTMSYYYLNVEPGYFIGNEPITMKNYHEYLSK